MKKSHRFAPIDLDRLHAVQGGTDYNNMTFNPFAMLSNTWNSWVGGGSGTVEGGNKSTYTDPDWNKTSTLEPDPPAYKPTANPDGSFDV